MENKFTDNEIMKALECCVNDDEGVRGFCNNGCPLFGKNTDCPEFLRRNAFDLINRQKAENERLNVELVGMRGACESYKMHYDNAKAENAELQRQLQEGIDLSDTALKVVKSEAIKEFVEKFEKRCISGGIYPAFIKNQLYAVKGDMTEGDKL